MIFNHLLPIYCDRPAYEYNTCTFSRVQIVDIINKVKVKN